MFRRAFEAFLLMTLVPAVASAQGVAAPTPAELARQIADLEERLARVTQQNQQLLGLLREIETMKADIARMRGQDEEFAHRIETLGKRQNDLYVDLDQRLGELTQSVRAAPQPAPLARTPASTAQAGANAPIAAAPAAPAAANAQTAPQLDPLLESRTYEAAFKHFRDNNFNAAISGFRGFLRAYPDSPLAPNAQYWIGLSLTALKDHKAAIAHQQKLLVTYPTSNKVPDALLNIATNQVALDDLEGARKTLEQVLSQHPNTEAARLATRRLTALK